MSEATLVGGQVVYGVHDETMCVGEYCTIHRFSNHHMVEWPQVWSWGLMFRICEHEIPHHDPDDLNYRGCVNSYCDGCCIPPSLEEIVRSVQGYLEELS